MSYTRLHWRPDEDAYLIRTYPTLTGKQQADELQRPYNVVIDRRSLFIRAGRIDPHQRKFQPLWSKDEDALLLDLITEGVPLSRIAKRMRRTFCAVVCRCRKIGGVPWLRRPKDGHQVRTIDEVAALFGVGSDQVGRWIAATWLTGRRNSKRRGSHWLITDSALMDFVANRLTWFAWKAERITDPDWRQHALWERERARGRWLTTQQAAQQIGISRTSVLRQIEAGKLPATRHGQQRYYIWSADIP